MVQKVETKDSTFSLSAPSIVVANNQCLNETPLTINSNEKLSTKPE